MDNNYNNIDKMDYGKDDFWPFWDDFVFMMVMQDAKVCADFLRMVLPEEDFMEVKVRPQDNPMFMDPTIPASNFAVETQKTMKFQRSQHGVRLDVLAKGSKQWANIEMQVAKVKELGKRTRYYRANMDLEQLSAGAEYEELKRNFIIFICREDPIGEDQPVYFFRSWDTNLDLPLYDDAYTIVLYTKCTPSKVPLQLKAFYEYLNDSTKCEGSPLVIEINNRVQKYNSLEWRTRRMKFNEILMDQYRKGCKEATERVNKLNQLLIAQNRMDDLQDSIADPAYQQQLFEEFGL